MTEANRLADMLIDAIRLAMSGRRGPVVLHVPRAILGAALFVPHPIQDQTPAEIADRADAVIEEIVSRLTHTS